MVYGYKIRATLHGTKYLRALFGPAIEDNAGARALQRDLRDERVALWSFPGRGHLTLAVDRAAGVLRVGAAQGRRIFCREMFESVCAIARAENCRLVLAVVRSKAVFRLAMRAGCKWAGFDRSGRYQIEVRA